MKSNTAVRVAIIGANGQLGSDVLRVFSTQPYLDPIPLTHADIEITDPAIVAQALCMEPQVVINTAAWHGARAETEVGASFRVNAAGPKLLADWCRGHNAALVHISTEERDAVPAYAARHKGDLDVRIPDAGDHIGLPLTP